MSVCRSEHKVCYRWVCVYESAAAGFDNAVEIEIEILCKLLHRFSAKSQN